MLRNRSGACRESVASGPPTESERAQLLCVTRPLLATVVCGYRDDRERRRREGGAARLAMLSSHNPEQTLRAVERTLDRVLNYV